MNSEPLLSIEASDLLVVGSGVFGMTVAEQAASEGFKVSLLERRGELGGNAFSYNDPETGIEVHKYGSHLFHTSNQQVWDYVNRFTSFSSYSHKVIAKFGENVYPMPINLATMSAFFGRSLTPSEAKQLIIDEVASVKDSQFNDDTFESKAISTVGLRLYEAFFKGYTWKQWQTNPRELPSEIFGRLPVRYDFNSRYFSDPWEGLPLDGYSSWFKNMTSHPSISCFFGIDFFEIRHLLKQDLPIVYTGPIDRYFEYSEGSLNWRTLDFQLETMRIKDFQGTSVMNFCDLSIPYTRIHEFRHLHPERDYPSDKTILMYEYSRSARRDDEPFYPVNTLEDRVKLKKYRARANNEQSVFFGGRLGSYQYLDMHMAIASALTMYRNEISLLLKKRRIN